MEEEDWSYLKTNSRYRSYLVKTGPFIKNNDMNTSDEDSNFDRSSIVTGFSDNKSIIEEGTEDGEESQEELLEDKLKEDIDGLTQKSTQGRITCLQSLSKAFITTLMPDFVHDRRFTLTDAIEKCLKKGRGEEQASAAHLATLLCFQSNDLAQDIRTTIEPVLNTLLRDNSVSTQARAKCCYALALINFLAGGELNDIVRLMQSLEMIFSGSYIKGNGTQPTISPEVAALHASALSAWSLLLTIMLPGDVYTLMSCNNDNSTDYISSVEKLCGLLKSSSLEVRMAAGECICLAFELGRSHHSDFKKNYEEYVVDELKQLATDSHKYRAKKDRKTQRSSFRDILRFVESNISPDVHVKFGQEMLLLDTWSRKKQYDTFCTVLGSGMNLHLSNNKLLREIFELGEKIVLLNSSEIKQSKHDRHLANAAAFKARTISRGKNRDKRSVVMAC